MNDKAVQMTRMEYQWVIQIQTLGGWAISALHKVPVCAWYGKGKPDDDAQLTQTIKWGRASRMTGDFSSGGATCLASFSVAVLVMDFLR